MNCRETVPTTIPQPESYTLLSQQRVAANEKPVEEIVLLPSLARALILAGMLIHPIVIG